MVRFQWQTPWPRSRPAVTSEHVFKPGGAHLFLRSSGLPLRHSHANAARVTEL